MGEMIRSHLWLSLVATVGLWLGTARAGTMEFDSRRDWEKWVFPVGTLELSNDGLVKPKFVKTYSNLNSIIENAVKKYCFDVKMKKFP